MLNKNWRSFNAKKVALFLVFFFIACGFRGQDIRARPDNWSQPVANSSVKNFYRVNEYVYRSAQPDAEGMQEMHKMGIRNILNLRSRQTDESRVKGLELTLHNVKMFPHYIEDEDIIEALRIIKSAKEPLLIHCLYGSDRTGVVVAMYRIVLQNWTKEQAMEEMKNGGYGFHTIYQNIPSYIKNADIERIRAKVNKP
jgi:protein tyrosine/serine phosphatase